MINYIVFLILVLPQTEAWWFFKSENEVCYPPYGCFDNEPPYNNAKKKLPHSPSDQDIWFRIYTRQNRYWAYILRDDDEAGVRESHYNPACNTKIIIHGFKDDGESYWIRRMTAAFLDKEDCNVIVVDWRDGAKLRINSIYAQAAANTRLAGAVTAQMVKTLIAVGARLDTFHIIGHSLGAHVAGYAGERLPGLKRITGMDPAGPLFRNEAEEVRLDKSDAAMVEVMHTDGEKLLQVAFGLMSPCGHVDFYPAGGRDQPGCAKNLGQHVFDAITSLGQDVACSHMRVIDYFIESIKGGPGAFTGYPCKNDPVDMKECSVASCGGSGCPHMGYNLEESTNGKFYVPVIDKEPYCYEGK